MRTYRHLQEALANTVESIRKSQKMPKIVLADFSSLQDSYVRGITKGRRNPTVTAIYSICEALNISPVDFFAKVEEERLRLLKVGKE